MKKDRDTKALTVVTVVLAFVFALAATASAADIKVSIPAEVQVNGEEIHLGDLAEIDGPACAFVNDLSEVYITKAPQPGTSMIIRLAYLEHKLNATGLPLDQAQWSVPAQVRVIRPGQEITEAFVRDVVEEYLASVEPYKDGEWELLSVRAPRLPRLPLGELTWRVAPNHSSKPTSVSLNIYLSVDDQEETKVRVTGEVDLMVRAVVASHRLERNQTIGPEDVMVTKVSLARLRTGAIADVQSAIGLATRRDLQAGRPILARDLYRQAVVHRGDMVTILARSGPLKVTSTGEVRQDGAIGDTIKVVNVGSDKTIVAKVLGPDVVEVQF